MQPALHIREPALRFRGRFALDLFLLARPWFWPVSLLPYYVGFVLATHRLTPAVAELPPLSLGAIVAGPLVWLAVLAVNDAHDLPGDRLNPRKAGSPLTSGRMSTATAARIAVVAAVTALGAAALVGTAFTIGTLLVLVLGWIYSVPPLRLKERPGADAAVNALAIGAIGPAAGWCAVESIGGFPWLFALQGTLVGVALYLPTTLVDHAADEALGYRTIAVRLGRRTTYRLGFAAWIAAAALAAGLALADLTIPRHMFGFELVMVPALIAAYHLLLARVQSFYRIAVVSGLFLIPSAVFVLTYTGRL
ncbi:MAG TPA: UbiA family prenyltransferase [Mycobacteriales bacterium]|nr:UbiA family prenyltransferase [Mycobacteriales bacterium]